MIRTYKTTLGTKFLTSPKPETGVRAREQGKNQQKSGAYIK